MIHSIYIVNQSGETEAAVTLGEFQADEALFGGFMSAIRTFSEHVLFFAHAGGSVLTVLNSILLLMAYVVYWLGVTGRVDQLLGTAS